MPAESDALVVQSLLQRAFMSRADEPLDFTQRAGIALDECASYTERSRDRVFRKVGNDAERVSPPRIGAATT